MTVRPAEAHDAERVTRLLAALGRPAVAHESAAQHAVFTQHLADGACTIFLAEDDGAAAGVVSLWFRSRLNWTSPEAWVPDLYVDPAFRRRGHARALLDACVKEARSRGCHRLVLESGHERTEAHRLYEEYGFVHTGRSYGLQLA